MLECAELGEVSQTKRLANAADEMREALAYQAGLWGCPQIVDT